MSTTTTDRIRPAPIENVPPMTNTPAERNSTAMVGDTSAMASPTTSGMFSRRTSCWE
jgi:hypothetical protein